jgi:hypothetical protein
MAQVDKFPRAPEVVVEIGQPVADAGSRLGSLLAGRPSVERRTSTSTDRRLVGQVEGANVRLSVWDANGLTRRKGWKVEFRGAFEPAPGGAVLRGAVEIPDRAQLRILMWMFRVASAFVPVLVLGLDIRGLWAGRPLDPAPAIGAISLAVAAFLVVGRVEADGQRQAQEDADLLAAGLGRLLRE